MDPIGKTPREYWTDVRAVERFSIHMLDKMRKNAHKAHWSTVTQQWLLNRAMDELRELQDAVNEGDPETIVKEAADVANFAMMIADNAKEETP
jgi:NTP pyrophosphatase (non-canonical NTP hydrolase)